MTRAEVIAALTTVLVRMDDADRACREVKGEVGDSLSWQIDAMHGRLEAVAMNESRLIGRLLRDIKQAAKSTP